VLRGIAQFLRSFRVAIDSVIIYATTPTSYCLCSAELPCPCAHTAHRAVRCAPQTGSPARASLEPSRSPPRDIGAARYGGSLAQAAWHARRLHRPHQLALGPPWRTHAPVCLLVRALQSVAAHRDGASHASRRQRPRAAASCCQHSTHHRGCWPTKCRCARDGACSCNHASLAATQPPTHPHPS
jgi:hypothetical protein